MHYRIKGTDERTRARVELLIDAPNEPAAWRDAKSRGLIVSSIEPTDAIDARRPDEPVTVRLAPGQVLLTERTAKTWKGLFAISALLLVTGLCAAVWIVAREPRNLSHPTIALWFSLAAAGVGCVGVFTGRLAAWWHHG